MLVGVLLAGCASDSLVAARAKCGSRYQDNNSWLYKACVKTEFETNKRQAKEKFLQALDKALTPPPGYAESQRQLWNGANDVMQDYARNRSNINRNTVPSASPTYGATGCLFEKDQTSGMYKTCFYKCAGGRVAKTIDSAGFCPLQP